MNSDVCPNFVVRGGFSCVDGLHRVVPGCSVEPLARWDSDDGMNVEELFNSMRASGCDYLVVLAQSDHELPTKPQPAASSAPSADAAPHTPAFVLDDDFEQVTWLRP